MKEKEVKAEAVKVFLREGYSFWSPPKVRYVTPFGIRYYDDDIFGIFDFVIARKNRIRFVQVTTATNRAHRRKKMKAVMNEKGFDFKTGYLWAFNAKKRRFVRERITRDNAAEAV